MRACFLLGLLSVLTACAQKISPDTHDETSARHPETILNDKGEELTPQSKVLSFDELDFPVERSKPVLFTLPNNEIHWYEVVHTPQGGINWVQAKQLAEAEGGYLASIHSLQENEFLFWLVRDLKFWYRFDHGGELFNLSGPFLGGFQPQGATEPDGGWRWASGEAWTFERWQKEDLPIGNKMKPDNQPNNNNGNQNVLAFGEVDLPVSYWSDVPHIMSTHNSGGPSCYGFIIEYEQKPD